MMAGVGHAGWRAIFQSMLPLSGSTHIILCLWSRLANPTRAFGRADRQYGVVPAGPGWSACCDQATCMAVWARRNPGDRSRPQPSHSGSPQPLQTQKESFALQGGAAQN